MPLELERTDEEATILSTFAAVTTETLITNTSSTHTDEGVNQLEFILMVLIPLILLAVLFLSVIFLVTCYKRKRTKQGKYFVCPRFETIVPCVNERSIKQNTFCFYTEPSSQGSQSALQTCEYFPNTCLAWGMGQEKEPGGFKVKLYKIVNDE